MRLLRAAAGISFALAVAGGCGLDVTGTLAPAAGDDGGSEASLPPPPAGEDSGQPGDDAASDAPPSCTCTLAPTAGFTLVAFAPGRTDACPAGFDTQDLVANPVGGPSACTCATCSMTPPSCTGGTVGTKNDNNRGDGVCNNAGATHPTNNGACTTFSNTYADYGQSVPPAPVGGSCTSASTPNLAGVTSDSVRACAPAGSSCACAPGLPSSFATCMRADGDVACPASAPNKHLVGTAPTVACGTCACALSSSCTGTLSFYSDTMCNTLVASDPSDACNNHNGTGSYGSYKWIAGAPTTTCMVTPPATPTPGLASPATICCP